MRPSIFNLHPFETGSDQERNRGRQLLTSKSIHHHAHAHAHCEGMTQLYVFGILQLRLPLAEGLVVLLLLVGVLVVLHLLVGVLVDLLTLAGVLVADQRLHMAVR